MSSSEGSGETACIRRKDYPPTESRISLCNKILVLFFFFDLVSSNNKSFDILTSQEKNGCCNHHLGSDYIAYSRVSA